MDRVHLIEAAFFSNLQCCSMKFSSLHDLLDHLETDHLDNPNFIVSKKSNELAHEPLPSRVLEQLGYNISAYTASSFDVWQNNAHYNIDDTNEDENTFYSYHNADLPFAPDYFYHPGPEERSCQSWTNSLNFGFSTSSFLTSPVSTSSVADRPYAKRKIEHTDQQNVEVHITVEDRPFMKRKIEQTDEQNAKAATTKKIMPSTPVLDYSYSSPRFRCPELKCIKTYKNLTGLKYHVEKGKCVFP